MSPNNLPKLPGPLSAVQAKTVQAAIDDLSAAQMQWLSGYLAGLAAAQAIGVEAAQANTLSAVATQASVTVLYGSQTGNAGGIAKQLYGQLETAGVRASLQDLADYNPRQLKTEQYIALVTSTHGDGDPPDSVLTFYEFLFSRKAPRLETLKYGVMALGDSSYEQFCQTGKTLDERLAELGAERLHDRVDADVDYQAEAKQWRAKWQEVAESLQVPTAGTEPPRLSIVADTKLQWSRFEPYTAEVLDNRRITGRDSDRIIHHLEFSLADSALTYQPGAALGVWPENSERLVDEILTAASSGGHTLDEKAPVDIGDEQVSLREALTSRLELTQVHPGLVEFLATASEELQQLVAAGRKTVLDFIHRNQVVELLKSAAYPWTAQELVNRLRGLTPRLYSIASSQEAVGEEIHLTVKLEVDKRAGTERFGAASYFLCRLDEGAAARVFVEPNRNFRLPEDDEASVIMVGPGTGIAPFRGFMQQREAAGATGENWLFFGNPHFSSDFLYQTEWQSWRKSGLLNRIDLAFSRDQAGKIYVQDRLAEHAKELFAWLEQGAHFYVCGEQTQMAKSVDKALHSVIAEHSGKGKIFAKEYVQKLRNAGRYQRDVY